MTASSPSAALVQRFLSSATERLTGLAASSVGLASAADSAAVSKLGRALHTLKGEARLLGVDEVEELTHACEDMLAAAGAAQGIDDEAEQLTIECLDVLIACVTSRAQGEAPPVELARHIADRLRAKACAGAESPAAARPGSVASASADRRVPAGGASSTDVASANASGERFVPLALSVLDRLTGLVAGLAGSVVTQRQLAARLLALGDGLSAMVRRSAAEQGAALGPLAQEARDLARVLRDNDFRLERTCAELSDSMRAARLAPLHSVLSQYPSFVRRTAREQGKQLRLEIEGDNVTVDQRVLDAIAEPCLHIVRNAVTHGVETPAERRAAGKSAEATVHIRASQDGDMVRLEVADDGRGIDLERVRQRAVALGLLAADKARELGPDEATKLIFLPGLSTASSTDTLCGRGIGLDIVKRVVEQMGGSVRVDSRAGAGTHLTLLVPVSLSLARALHVRACDQVFAIPNAAVVEMFWLPVKDIQRLDGREVTSFRDRLLPLVRLREALGLVGIKDLFTNKVGVVVLRVEEELAGFVVDGFVGEREIVAQPLGAYLGRPHMLSGVTLADDGEVVLLLHAPDLIRAVRESNGARHVAAMSSTSAQRRVLFVEDSFITREYAADVLRAQGYEVSEAGDGVEALELLGKGDFDIVLTDLQMPRLDGFKLTAAIRQDERLRHLPVLVLSTLESDEARRMALAAGADAYLIKSRFSPETLLEAIRQALG